MNEDTPFRITLIVVFIVRSIPGLYFWLRARSTGEKLDRRQEGLLILVGLRLAGAVYGVGVVAWLIHPEWMAWSSLPLPLWLRWIGVGLVVASALIVTWGLQTLGKNFTDTVVIRKNHTLVTNGPYRWVRHPLYSGYFVMVFGATLLMSNWFPAVSGAAALTLVVIRTRIEEEKLIERFGDEYQAYMNRVGRFLPRLRRAA